MKILFLDDNLNRRNHASNHFKNDELYIAETAQEAINLLKDHSPYDLVMLDHDLGGKVFCPSDEVSGYEVAKFIATISKDILPKYVVIHTHNYAGAKNMLNILKDIVPVKHAPYAVIQ